MWKEILPELNAFCLIPAIDLTKFPRTQRTGTDSSSSSNLHLHREILCLGMLVPYKLKWMKEEEEESRSRPVNNYSYVRILILSSSILIWKLKAQEQGSSPYLYLQILNNNIPTTEWTIKCIPKFHGCVYETQSLDIRVYNIICEYEPIHCTSDTSNQLFLCCTVLLNVCLICIFLSISLS
jgi:hypothetical protein